MIDLYSEIRNNIPFRKCFLKMPSEFICSDFLLVDSLRKYRNDYPLCKVKSDYNKKKRKWDTTCWVGFFASFVHDRTHVSKQITTLKNDEEKTISTSYRVALVHE